VFHFLTAASGNESSYGDSDNESIDGDMPHSTANTTSATANTANTTITTANTPEVRFAIDHSPAAARPRNGSSSSSNNNNSK
jgi:hypothetical protein